MINFVLYELL